MALIQCPDCGKSISDSAPTCIGCGRPMIQPDHKPEDILPPELLSGKSNTTNKLDVNALLSVDIAPFTDQNARASAYNGSGCLVVALGLFLILAFFGSGSSSSSVNRINRPVAIRQSKTGEINGYDSATNKIIDPINVFLDYENRNLGLAGKVNHGEKVTILENSGNGVKIKTSSGVTGWVSSWFVKENQ